MGEHLPPNERRSGQKQAVPAADRRWSSRSRGQQSSSVAGALADTFNPLDNPFDGDAGHHGDDVIKLGSSSPDLVELDDETPKPNKCAATKFFISRRKRPITATKSSSSSSEATDELLKMRREEHEAKMDLLAWKTAYWRRKYEAEFGSTQ